MASHIEREDKYDVDPAFDLPAALGPALVEGRTASEAEHGIDNVYWDTADGALRSFGATLRRRHGGADAGWHLKLPLADGARAELHSGDPAAAAPPEDLVARIAGLIRGRPLAQVARLHEHRISYVVRDPAGRDLVEVDDDEVRATVMGDAATAIAWREVEVEEATSADGGEPGQLRVALGKRLRAAGASRSSYPSKLERALSAANGNSAAPPDTAAESDNPLVAYIRAQYTALVSGDVDLRGGQAGVHKTRVASRRMRSTLRSFGALFDADALGDLEGELRWYAQVLGEVREQEVLGERLVAQAHALPPELVLGPVVATIQQDVAAARSQALVALSEAMSSPRYFAMLDAAQRFAADPPLRRRARRSRVQSAAKKAERTAVKRLRRAMAPEGTDEQLHSARKAGKRARYAAEVLAPADKKQARAAQRFEALQEALGEHQDAVVAAEVLRRLGAASASRPDWNGFTFGLLLAGQQQAATQARREAGRWLRRYGR